MSRRKPKISPMLFLHPEDDKNNSDAIESALEIVGMEFFNVTIATDDHNEDSVSVMQLKQEFSNAIECALEMVGMEFLNVTIATDDHKEDSFSVLQ